jgi:hypothetical protein
MKKELNEQLKRMQVLAGLITEANKPESPKKGEIFNDEQKEYLDKNFYEADEWELVDYDFITNDDMDDFNDSFLDTQLKDKTLIVNRENVPRIVKMFNDFLTEKGYKWQVSNLLDDTDNIFMWKIVKP